MCSLIMRYSCIGGSSWIATLLGMVCLTAPLAVAAPQDESRVWRDATGKFEINAKFVKQEDDQVQLLKQDGRLITVPVAALSETDQQFLLERAAAMEAGNPFAGGVPADSAELTIQPGDLERLKNSYSPEQLPAVGEAVFMANDEPVPPLAPDPENRASVHRFVQPLPKFDAYAKLSAPLLLNPQSGLIGLSAHRVGNAVSDETFGRVFLYDPKQKKPALALDIEQTLKIFDHHAGSNRTLAVLGLDSNSERGGDLVWLVGLASGQPSALGRWRLPGWDKPGFKPKVEFARLLDATTALVQVNDTVFVWDLQQETLKFQVERLPAGAKLAVSGTGKYLAVPQSKGCRVVDLEQGELLGNLTFPALLTPEPKFSPDGSQLALAAGNQLAVWDLSTAELRTELTLGSPNGHFYGWLNDHQLLTQLGGLVDLELGMAVWKYSLSPARELLLLDEGIVLAASSSDSFVAALEVPHAAVQAAAKRLAGGNRSMLALGPGSRVSLKVEAIDGVDLQAMEAGLKAAVEQAGWQVDPRAPIRIEANIGRGDKQKLYFRPIGSPLSERGEEVSIRPYTASVRIQAGTTELWSRSSKNMVPSFLRLEQGESVKQAVKKYERADPGFFERLSIPPKILKPEFAQAIGTSRLKNGQWTN